ncbi:hypothetical protein FRZ67_19300 [Panacibacter ginsenosidivorans]|uniref:Uncharacterized protein n=1 Tax=Panacibacter ginsenosidivorans TaxID=1813871 RepID=A0A5B8VGB6_9BACT|nr:zinc-finger-containing protein [Panacibacter ginsenosidivorans]QEC69348.1 hypothetical protein FRZ67_19300 [Panacibacter ginsenosidivorans]
MDHSAIKSITKGEICPYCFKGTEYIDSIEVYGRSYGMIYICRDCNAYVGVHKGTNIALGRLANEELRAAKKRAHFFFDKIFKDGLIDEIWKESLPITSKRKKAYKWLSIQMGIPENECHIGYFDVDKCNQVIEICKPVLEEAGLEKGEYVTYESPKMIEAKKTIEDLGYKIHYRTNSEIRFLFKGAIVRYYPERGWASGQSIKDGRDLKNLVSQIKMS